MARRDKNNSLIAVATAIIVPCIVLTLCAVLMINLSNGRQNAATTAPAPEESHTEAQEYTAPEDAMYLWQYSLDEIASEIPLLLSEITTEETTALSEIVLIPITEENSSGTSSGADVQPTSQPAAATVSPELSVSAQGITSEGKYTGMRIYINGEYRASTLGLLTVRIKERGFLADQHKLTYNLYDGECTVDEDGSKHKHMASVTTSGGKTIVTVWFPNTLWMAVRDVSALTAESSYSLFRDKNGQRLEVFNVSTD